MPNGNTFQKSYGKLFSNLSNSRVIFDELFFAVDFNIKFID